MIEFDYPEGATPLNAHELEGLLPTNITTQAELDRWEQDNINEALEWIEGHEPKEPCTNNYSISHLIFTLSSGVPQSQNPQCRIATLAVSLNRSHMNLMQI